MMSFSDATKARQSKRVEDAKMTQIEKVLDRGIKVRKCGQYGGHQRFKIKGEGIVYNGNRYFDFHTGKGGDAIDYLQTYRNYTFNEALEELAPAHKYKEVREFVAKPKEAWVKVEDTITPEFLEQICEEFVFPEADMVKDKRRVFAYLTKRRMIDKEIVQWLVNNRYVRQDSKGNCVFVFKNNMDNAVGGDIRGTTGVIMDQTGMEYINVVNDADTGRNWSSYLGFSIKKGTPKKMYVFEANLDLIAYLCLNKGKPKLNNSIFVSMSGVHKINVLRSFMMMYPEAAKNLIFCTDNDEAGEGLMLKHFAGVEYERETPTTKDWNDDLKFGLYPNSGNAYTCHYEETVWNDRKFRKDYVNVTDIDGAIERVDTYFREWKKDDKGKFKWSKIVVENDEDKILEYISETVE
jgi:hypothetical protein